LDTLNGGDALDAKDEPIGMGDYDVLLWALLTGEEPFRSDFVWMKTMFSCEQVECIISAPFQ
jgi:hypothetical protein